MPSLSEMGVSIAEALGIKKKKNQATSPKIKSSVETKVIHGRYHENIKVDIDDEGRTVHAYPDNETGFHYAPPRKRTEVNEK